VVLAAWFGRQSVPWIARWALAPAVVLAVLLLCGLGPLRSRFLAIGLVSAQLLDGTPVLVLWSVLVAGAALGVAGLVVTARRVGLPSGKRADSQLLYSCGWMASGALLVLCYVARAGNPELVGAVKASLSPLKAGISDILSVMVGARVAQVLLGAMTGAVATIFGGGWVAFLIVVAALSVVLVVHVASGGGCRWCRYVALALWGVLTAVGVLLTLGLAGRLFWGAPAEAMATPAGKWLAGHLWGRLLLLALFVGILWRFVDGLGAMYAEASAEPKPAAQRTPAPSELNSLGMLAGVAGLVLALMLGLSVSGEAVFYQIGRYWESLSGGFALAAVQVGDRSVYWSGAAVSAGAVVLMLVALHEETRQGRVSAYPWVAAVWGGLLAWLAALWAGRLRAFAAAWPKPPGERFALVAMGFIWLVLAITTVALWWRWWALERLRRRRGVALRPDDSGVETVVSASARSLGSVGLCVSLVLGALILYSALWTYSRDGESLRRMEAGVTKGLTSVAFFIDHLRTQLESSNLLRASAIALAALCAGLLIVHYIAQFGLRWAGAAATGLWSALLLVGVFLLGRLINFDTVGQWDVAELLTVLIAVAALGGVLTATARAWAALLGPPQAKTRTGQANGTSGD